MARDAAQIQLDLDAAYAARRAAWSAKSYSLDTGQGKQMVQRANIDEIETSIRNLENEMEEASGTGGNFHATLERPA